MSEPQPQSTSSPATSRASPAFECARTRGLGGLTLEFRGRLDAEAADRLQQILRDALTDARLVVLDLQTVDLIDPAGVLAIVQANQAARAEGRRLVIVRPPADVGTALRFDGTDGGLTVIETSAAARTAPHSVGGLELDIEHSAASDPPHCLLACRGEIDMATVTQLRDAIASLEPGDVIVDLSGTSFMDSTGLSALLDARLARQEHLLVVVCPAGPVRDVFRLTALIETLNVVDNRTAAERMLSG